MMKNNIYITLILVLGICSNLFAQNENYIFTTKSKILDNPAFAGFEKGYTVRITNKNHWKNFNSQYLLFSGTVNDRVGVGFSINKEEIFVQKNLAFFADFSYNIQIDETDRIYFGIKAGGELRNVDTSELKVYNENGRVSLSEDYLLQSYSDKFQPNIGVGVQYRSPKFFVGIGIPKIFVSDEVRLDGSNRVVKLSEQFIMNVLGGYFWDINDKFSLNPYARFIYAKGEDGQIEVASILNYDHFFDLGLSYRINESVSAFTLVSIPKTRFQLGYAYQMYSSDFSRYANGSHEFLIQYKFN